MRDLAKNGADFNRRFTKQVDEQHDGMSPLALACALQKKDFVSVSTYTDSHDKAGKTIVDYKKR
jgi:hypothetical protein